MKSITKGIIALIVVAAALLLSDLPNRKSAGQAGRKGASEQQAKPVGPYRICLVHYVDSHNSEDCEKGIRKALSEAKLIEGKGFTLKVFNAQGDVSTLNSIAGTIGNESWDLVFALSSPTIQLLAKKLPDQRMVFTNVGDPRAAGLGESFENHLPNITGISTMSDFEGMVRLISLLHPGVKRIGTVFTPAEINSVAYKEHFEAAATRAGIELVSVPANTATEVMDAAKSLISRKITAIGQISDNLTGSCSAAIIKASLEAKVPYYGFVTQQLEQGAVGACARDYYEAGREAGEMGVRVMRGEDPGKIPFRYVTKTEYMFNEAVASRFGLRETPEVRAAFPMLKIKKSE